MMKSLIRWLLTRLFRIKLTGFQHYEEAGDRVLIVANHVSYLDPILLWALLPDDITFAINTHIARLWWVKPGLRLAKVFEMDPMQPLSVKTLTHYLKENRKAAIFPEGRITLTGSLMKIYDGAGMIAYKSGARVLPIHIYGAQYTYFSYLRGIVKRRAFPHISITILPSQLLRPSDEASARDRRRHLGNQIAYLMEKMVGQVYSYHATTLFSALLHAKRVHGGGHLILEDVQRKPLSYNALIRQTFAMGRALSTLASSGEVVGLLLPNANITIGVLLGLQTQGRIPALLNFSSGVKHLMSACRSGQIKWIVTARRFIAQAKLESVLEILEKEIFIKVIYLEDITSTFRFSDRLQALAAPFTVKKWYLEECYTKTPAVVLFTSGSEGEPKGVVLSHSNLLSNYAQLTARLDLTSQDILLNVLPLFHAFGLTAGTLLPLLNGIKTFLYPSPLHYRIIPEIAYEIKATILFGTNTFLGGYAKTAHSYDFRTVRYVFAGAEKLQEETQRVWFEKFGIRILEGYGTTEASPVLSVNTVISYKKGTVGRLLPGVEWQLETIPGVTEGGCLHVRGANIMEGYFRIEHPGHLQFPSSCFGEGWYNTGDVATVEHEGFVRIIGRLKRFAKMGGEMVSLATVEELAGRLWPHCLHAAIACPDEKKGEKIILLSEYQECDRTMFTHFAKKEGYSELYIPKHITYIKSLPVLGSGKIDYQLLVKMGQRS